MGFRISVPILVLCIAVLMALVPSSESDGATYTEYLSPASDGGTYSYSVGDTITWHFRGNGFTVGYMISSVGGNPSWLVFHDEHDVDEDYLSGTATSSGVWTVAIHWTSVNSYGQPTGSGTASVILEVDAVAGTYSLQYVLQGGYDGPQDVIYTGSEEYRDIAVSSIVPVRTIHSFGGWNTARDGSGTSYSAGDAVTVYKDSVVVLYAQWTSVPQTVIDLNTVLTPSSISLLSGGAVTEPYSVETGYLWSLVPSGSSVTRDTVTSASGWVFMPKIAGFSDIVDWLIAEGYYSGEDSVTVYLNGCAVTWSYQWSISYEYGPMTGYYTASYTPNYAYSVTISKTIDLQTREEYYSATVRDEGGNQIGSAGDAEGLWIVWGSNDTGNWPQTSQYILNRGNYTLPGVPTLVSAGAVTPVTDGTVDVSGNSVKRVTGSNFVYSADGYYIWSAVPMGTSVGAETTASTGPSGWVFMPFVSDLDDFYQTVLDGLDESILNVLRVQGGTVTVYLDGPLVVKHDRWYFSSTFSITQGMNLYNGMYYLLEYGTDESAYITIDYETDLVKVYSASGSLLSTGYLTDYDIMWGSMDRGNMPNTFLSNNRGTYTFSPYLRIAVSEKDVTHYMDPSQGVKVTSTEGVQWSNGYDTSAMTIAFRTDRNAQERISWSWEGGDLVLDIRTLNGTTAFTVTVGGATTTYTLGMWKTFEVTMDLGEGSLTVKPIITSSWKSFQEYSTMDHVSVLADFEGHIGAFSSVIFYKVGESNAYTHEVVSTKVLLDTYGIVLYDASLDITKYWPEMADKRLNFYSFSVYGTSVTINGVTYPVDREHATIRIDDTDRTFTNVYIYYQDVEEVTHIFIKFVNDDTVLDLGPVVTYTLTFNGMWHFATGLWEGHPATRNVITWDIDHIDATADQLILLFEFSLIAISLALIALRRELFSALDYAVLVGAFVISVCMVGM